MRRLLIVLTIAFLIMGHTFSSQKNVILICEEDDLIELHSEVESRIC